jgi:hypothetical protein
LENVATQHNFCLEYTQSPVYEDLVKRLGLPITFDVAQVGSYAHRVHNYWTNLAPRNERQSLFDSIHVPPRDNIYRILQPGRHPRPVEEGERKRASRYYNIPEETRNKLPTLVSYKFSRGFRDGKAGCIFDERLDKIDEPRAVERELAMGYAPCSTACPHTSEDQRCSPTGQGMDMKALCSLWAFSDEFTHSGVGYPIKSNTRGPSLEDPSDQRDNQVLSVTATDLDEPESPDYHHNQNLENPHSQVLEHNITHVCKWHEDRPGNVLSILAVDPNTPAFFNLDCPMVLTSIMDHDVWLDVPCTKCIAEGTLPTDPSVQPRVRQVAQASRWYNSKLYKYVTAPRNSNGMATSSSPSREDLNHQTIT